LAYLLPVIRSGKRVIISTGTKTLQEQLFFKDIPFLKQHLGDLRVCYMKGRGNYLCRKKLYDLTSQPVLNGLEEISHFRIINDWEKTTETGDRAELSELPESSHLWPKLDARTDRCIGSECQQFDRCFITEMRRRAAESDIIIVNHHLFCADLAIKAATDRAADAGVLPDAGIVVFDEAHELEDVATDYFGVTVSNLKVDELLRDVENTLRRADIPLADVLQASARVREHSQFFFSLLPPGDGRFAFDNRAEFLEENGDEYLGLQNALLHLYTELQAIPKKPDEVHAMARRVDELKTQLGFILEAQDRNTVFWIDRRGDRRGGQHNVFLQATPITVSQILRSVLFEHLESAVLTSATLAVAGEFEYIRNRLGIQHARELVVPSHFDYESQALLYVPPDLPDPRDPRFVGAGFATSSATAGDYARTGVLPIHQLCADESALRAPAGRTRIPHAAAGQRAQECAAGGVPPHAQRGAVCNFVVLARGGCAGRTTELRHHRQAALRSPQRSSRCRPRPGH
jgi:ATP-dependent DNA helicase DinG